MKISFLDRKCPSLTDILFSILDIMLLSDIKALNLEYLCFYSDKTYQNDIYFLHLIYFPCVQHSQKVNIIKIFLLIILQKY